MFNKVLSLFRGTSTPPAAVTNALTGIPLVPACDLGGVIWVRNSTGTGGVSQTGGNINTDDLSPTTTIGTDNRSFMYLYDSVGNNWDRFQSLADTADNLAAGTSGLAGVIARLAALNSAGDFDRLRTLLDTTDAQVEGAIGLLGVKSRAQLYNNTGYDRQRNNTEFTVLASAARSATTNSADFINYNANALFIYLSITAVPGVQTIQPTIQVKNPITGAYITLGNFTAQVAAGDTLHIIMPTVNGTAATSAVNGIVPRTFRIQMVHSGAGSFTYSVGGALSWL